MSNDLLPYAVDIIDDDQSDWGKLKRNGSDSTINEFTDEDPKDINIDSVYNNIIRKNQTNYYSNMEPLNNPELIQMQLSLLEANINQLQLHHDTLTSLNEEENADRIDGVEKSIAQLKKDRETLKGKLEETTIVKSIFKNDLDIPHFSKDPKNIDWTLVYSILRSGVTGADKQQFQSTWNTIKSLTRNHNYSEEKVEALWRYSLDGEAKFYFESKRNLPFKERLTSLLNLYMPIQNIRTKLIQLKNLKRLKGQSISQYMSRLDFLLEETSISVAPELREGRRIHILEENLMKAASPSVREKILLTEALYFEQGIFLSIEEKIDIAVKQEAILNDMPSEEISVQLDNRKEETYNKVGHLFNTEAKFIDEKENCVNDHDEAESYNIFQNRSRSSGKGDPTGRGSRREDSERRRSASRDNYLAERRRVRINETPDIQHHIEHQENMEINNPKREYYSLPGMPKPMTTTSESITVDKNQKNTRGTEESTTRNTSRNE